MQKNENVRPIPSLFLKTVTNAFAEILRIHLRDEQLDGGVDLHSIARRTRYYSGSDLKSEFCVLVAYQSSHQRHSH